MNARVAWVAGAALLALAGLPAVAQTDARPLPAEILPLADRALALDITWTGRHYLVVGGRGHILASRDGREWAQVPAPARAALTAVDFHGEHGWAVGHDAVILHSSDGGRSWQLQNFEPELERPFHDVLFLDAERGLAIGAYGLIYGTDDGGETWTELDVPELQADEVHLNAITRLADGRLFIAGEYGLLAVSDDEGASWRRLLPPYASSMFGALPFGERGVLIHGLRGNVYIAEDVSAVPDLPEDFDVLDVDEALITGEGWRQVRIGTLASMFGGSVLPGGGYALVGLNGRVVFLDADGQPQEMTSASSGQPLAAAIVADDRLLVVGRGGIESLPLDVD